MLDLDPPISPTPNSWIRHGPHAPLLLPHWYTHVIGLTISCRGSP